MILPLAIPTIVAGDVEVTTLNAVNDLIEAGFNALPGENLRAASVPNSALATRKSVVPVVMSYDGDLCSPGSIAVLRSVNLPNLDGASNATYALLGWSIFCQTQTAGAGNQIEVQEDTVTITGGTINMNNTTYHGVSVSSLLATAYATSSAKKWSLKWTDGGAGSVIGLYMVLWFTVQHVGT